jgi:hypothetical protein
MFSSKRSKLKNAISQAATIVIVVIIIIIVAGGGYAAFVLSQHPTSGSTSTTLTTSTTGTSSITPNMTSFTVADFGITHPDAGAYGLVVNATSSGSPNPVVLKKYVPNVQLVDLSAGSGAVLSALYANTAQVGMLSGDAVVEAIANNPTNSTIQQLRIVATYRETPVGDYITVPTDSSCAGSKLTYTGSALNGTTVANSKKGSLDDVLDGLIAFQLGLVGGTTGKSYVSNTAPNGYPFQHNYDGSFQGQLSDIADCSATGAAEWTTGGFFDAYQIIHSSAPTVKSIGAYNETWPGFVMVARMDWLPSHVAALKSFLQGVYAVDATYNQQIKTQGSYDYSWAESYYGFTSSTMAAYGSTYHFTTNGTIYQTTMTAEINALWEATGIKQTNTTVLSAANFIAPSSIETSLGVQINTSVNDTSHCTDVSC